jgi:hypothetical protein
MQFCEPERPHMMAPNGRRHRRWEFMLVENEDAADFERPDHVGVAEAVLARDEATVVRAAVYEIRAAVADSYSFQKARRGAAVNARGNEEHKRHHRHPPRMAQSEICQRGKHRAVLPIRPEQSTTGSSRASTNRTSARR